MAEMDRGAYAPPTDGSLAFDPREHRRRRPLPITLILSVVILLVLITALVFLYRAGTGGDAGGPAGEVGEPVGAVREAPPAEAQPVDPATGLEVYTDEPDGGAPVFTAPPEAPIARQAPLPAPTPAPTTPTGTTGLADPAPPAPVATPAPPPVARPTSAAPPPAAARPAAPAPARPAPPAAAPVTARPAPAPVPATAAPLAVPAGTAGAVTVQIGAYATRAQAQAALAGRPGGAGQRIEEVQVGGRTLYRAIATGFRSRAEAQGYCASGCIIR